MMHVCDASDSVCCTSDSDAGAARFSCAVCGHETDWMPVRTTTEAKRGIPCPDCNHDKEATRAAWKAISTAWQAGDLEFRSSRDGAWYRWPVEHASPEREKARMAPRAVPQPRQRARGCHMRLTRHTLELTRRAWNPCALPPVTKLVLLAYCLHSNDQGACWPSLARVAAHTGLNTRTVQRHIRTLETAGVLAAPEPRPRRLPRLPHQPGRPGAG